MSDSNVSDCNGDGVAGDYDGDYETGLGGGFFGHGLWANEPSCNYGLAVHGGSVTVASLVFGHVPFLIGADDMKEPEMDVDPVDGSTVCSTTGSIMPGDRSFDPTADEDDCLTGFLLMSGTTCGAGSDGGYWVIIRPGVPTAGLIIA